jgi:hypothetical protein
MIHQKHEKVIKLELNYLDGCALDTSFLKSLLQMRKTDTLKTIGSLIWVLRRIILKQDFSLFDQCYGYWNLPDLHLFVWCFLRTLAYGLCVFD